MSGPFVKRKVNVRFVLDAASGTFDGGTNTVDLKGLRVHCSIVNNQSTSLDQCDLEIFGVPLGVMNRLTILQNGYTQGIRNYMQVTAGDGDNMALIFNGQVHFAWADFSGQPEAVFIASAFSSLGSAYASVAPTSFKGTVDAATVASSIAQQLTPPLTLHNSGVTAQLDNPYLPGDALHQLRALAEQADFEYATDEEGVLAIWPRGKARDTAAVQISSETGLVGFPSYNDRGVMLTTLFNPSVRVNGPVNVQSKSEPANGVWYPFHVQHDLESEVPDGRWYSHMECQKFTGQGDQVEAFQ